MRFGRILRRMAERKKTQTVLNILRDGILIGRMQENERITTAGHKLSYEAR
jgi:hypothetical protein